MPQTPPFFTVVIPVYNKENYIEFTLNSVIGQTFKDYEVILVNDGSTDNSISIIKKLIDKRANFKLIEQENQGAPAARNTGILSAKGKYIAFLDADDYWYPSHLATLHKSILKFPLEKVFCTNYEMEFSKTNIKQPKFSYELTENINVVTDFFEASHKNCIASTPSLAIETELAQNELFDVNIKSGQDTDLFIRLALKNNFIFSKKVTVKHIRHAENSLSKSKFVGDRNLIVEKHKAKESQHPSLKKYLDMNRFAIALWYLKNDQKSEFQRLKKEILFKNLTLKRKLIYLLPGFLTKLLKK